MELLNRAYQSNADLWLQLKSLLAELEVLQGENPPNQGHIDQKIAEINTLKQAIKASSQALE